MSRGRARHHGSRRRAYSGRQREVRERRTRLAREDQEWSIQRIDDFEVDAGPEPDQPFWLLRLDGRATAA